MNPTEKAKAYVKGAPKPPLYQPNNEKTLSKTENPKTQITALKQGKQGQRNIHVQGAEVTRSNNLEREREIFLYFFFSYI